MTLRALVWGENVHEQTSDVVREIYPDGMHRTIADALAEDAEITAATATLQDPEHGLTEARLADTDVLFWWGHAAHGDVADHVVDRVVDAVWSGMGLVVLHSGHFSKPFKRLMGTSCALTWREAGERERIWVTAPNHPIVAGLPPFFELESEEMYGEPFAIPEPEETVMLGWFEGGEVFRSGVTYRRGAGRVFYFQPGHETYPTYYDPTIRTVLRNACHWVYNPAARIVNPGDAPNRPAEDALEPLTVKGPRLHKDGEEGFR
ncbi:MAG: ThuA domain-containing protein [Pseudomonadota bacterium]